MDRRIAGCGTREQTWLDSAWLAAAPYLPSHRALTGAARRIVVLAPHPDDEVLGCGGLLSAAAREGQPILVVAVTDGERCYPDDRWWTPQRLRAARRRELRAALTELGGAETDTVHLAIDDGGVAAAESHLVERLVERLHRDDLVLAPWELDGHPDHEATGRASRRAVRRVGARLLRYPVWGWHWARPDLPQLRAVHAVRCALDPRARADKQRAIARFATQIGTCTPAVREPVLSARILARFARPFETFFT